MVSFWKPLHIYMGIYLLLSIKNILNQEKQGKTKKKKNGKTNKNIIR